jgi:hypothetical protein
MKKYYSVSESFLNILHNYFKTAIFIIGHHMNVTHKININGLKAGIYFVIVQTPNGKASKKMIIQ